jgi:hypothetical protein
MLEFVAGLLAKMGWEIANQYLLGGITALMAWTVGWGLTKIPWDFIQTWWGRIVYGFFTAITAGLPMWIGKIDFKLGPIRINLKGAGQKIYAPIENGIVKLIYVVVIYGGQEAVRALRSDNVMNDTVNIDKVSTHGK